MAVRRPPGIAAFMFEPGSEIGSSGPHTWNSSPLGGQGRPSAVSHIPEKSGLPPRVRGAGAVRLTFPSGARGTPAVGYLNH
jgi:hypothetical protein